jgi:hypothetical protein
MTQEILTKNNISRKEIAPVLIYTRGVMFLSSVWTNRLKPVFTFASMAILQSFSAEVWREGKLALT